MNVLRWKKPSKYNLVDNIVCHGLGIASGSLAAFLTDRVIQSSQGSNLTKRFLLDVSVMAVAYCVVTGVSYLARSLLFYEEIHWNRPGGVDDDYSIVIDKRTGESVKFYEEIDPNENRWGHTDF